MTLVMLEIDLLSSIMHQFYIHSSLKKKNTYEMRVKISLGIDNNNVTLVYNTGYPQKWSFNKNTSLRDGLLVWRSR